MLRAAELRVPPTPSAPVVISLLCLFSCWRTIFSWIGPQKLYRRSLRDSFTPAETPAGPSAAWSMSTGGTCSVDRMSLCASVCVVASFMREVLDSIVGGAVGEVVVSKHLRVRKSSPGHGMTRAKSWETYRNRGQPAVVEVVVVVMPAHNNQLAKVRMSLRVPWSSVLSAQLNDCNPYDAQHPSRGAGGIARRQSCSNTADNATPPPARARRILPDNRRTQAHLDFSGHA